MTTCIAVALAVYGFRHREDSMGFYFFLLMCAVAEWSFFRSLEAAAATRFYKILWAEIEYFGITGVSVLWFLLAVVYGRGSRRTLAIFHRFLWIIPAITVTAAFTNNWHGLIWREIVSAENTDPLISAGTHLVYHHGPWFWINISYSYILLFAGSLLLIKEALLSKHLYRSQPVIMITGALFPWAANILYISRLGPLPGVDLTSMAFSMSGIFIFWGILRYRFLGVAPISHDKILEQMNDGIILLDEDNCIAEINSRACQLTGIEAGVKIGTALGSVSETLAEVMNKACPPSGSFVEMKIQGAGEIVLEIQFDAVYDKRSRYRGCLILLRDVTERKANEEKLNILSRAVEQSPATVVITDKDGTIEYVNPAFSLITGYASEEVIGKNPRVLKSGNKSPEEYQELWDTILHGHIWRGEFLNKKKGGDLYWEQASISPILNSNGEITHFVGVKEDITQRKLSEEALRVNEENLRKRNEIIENDLASAQMMQRSFLPELALEVDRLTIAYRYIPLDAVGGDYLSFRDIDAKGLGVFLGDVQGHGVSAALFVSMLKVVSDRVLQRWDRFPREFMMNLNQVLYSQRLKNFITALYCYFNLDHDGGVHFRFSRGGHPYPVMYRAKDGETSFLPVRGGLLGSFPGSVYEEGNALLARGDRIFLYTDGIPETLNPQGDPLGYDGITELFHSNHKDSLEETLDSIIDALSEFRKGAALEDDLVLIGVEVR